MPDVVGIVPIVRGLPTAFDRGGTMRKDAAPMDSCRRLAVAIVVSLVGSSARADIADCAFDQYHVAVDNVLGSGEYCVGYIDFGIAHSFPQDPPDNTADLSVTPYMLDLGDGCYQLEFLFQSGTGFLDPLTGGPGPSSIAIGHLNEPLDDVIFPFQTLSIVPNSAFVFFTADNVPLSLDDDNSLGLIIQTRDSALFGDSVDAIGLSNDALSVIFDTAALGGGTATLAELMEALGIGEGQLTDIHIAVKVAPVNAEVPEPASLVVWSLGFTAALAVAFGVRRVRVG